MVNRFFFRAILISAFFWMLPCLSGQTNLENARYAQLKDYLARYRQIAENGGWPKINEGKVISLGMPDARINNIRQRLFITGELISVSENTTGIFDSVLMNAVIQFQARHGLKTTGRVDSKTIRELNVPVAARIHQLELNVERWENLPAPFETQYIIVNIAAGNMEVIENDVSVLSMKVIVGRFDRKTPVFNSTLTHLEFNPRWVIPPGIMKKDVLPAIKKDAAYIAKNKMNVLYNGSEINPNTIDWRNMDANNMPYTLVQYPGPENPMGVVKFMLPNRYFVFMHDTPHQALFESSSHMFSSGCIRLQKATALANYLLKKDQGWSPGITDSLIKAGQSIEIYLNQPFKIYITYFTAWVNHEGSLCFSRDIYRKDT